MSEGERENKLLLDNYTDFGKTKRGLMPAGFLDLTDMSDIKREVRRKKRIITRWHLYIILSLNPTLLKYRFRNAVKSKRLFHLDLINQMNPMLHWPTTAADIKTNNNNKNGVSEAKESQHDKKEEDDKQLVQYIIDREDKKTNHQNFFMGDQKVDVRYTVIVKFIFTERERVEFY